MSRNNQSIFNLAGVNPTAEISKHLNKKGKITNASKKERKALKSICPHQCINRKGKVKPRVEKAENRGGKGQWLKCQICGEYYKGGFYSDMEYDEAYNKFKPICSQAKMLGAALDVNKQTMQQICETNLYVDNFKGVYTKMRKVGQKQQEVERKKKNKRKERQMGSWNIR